MSGNPFQRFFPSSFVNPVFAVSTQSAHRQVMLGSQVLLAFQQIAELDQQTGPVEQFLQSVVNQLSQTIQFPLVAVELYQANTQTLTVAASTARTERYCQPLSLRPADLESGLEPDLTLSQKAIETGLAQVFSAAADPGLEPKACFPFQPEDGTGVQTLIKVPLPGAATTVGVLSLASPLPLPEAHQIAIWATTLAHYLGSLVWRRQQMGQQQRYLERLEILGSSLKGFSYDWNLISGEVERIPPLAAVFGGLEDHREQAAATAFEEVEDWLRFVHPQDRERVTTFFEGIWKQTDLFELDYRVVDDQDRTLAVSEQGRVLRSDRGDPVRVIGWVIPAETHLAPPAPDPGIAEDSSTPWEVLENIKTVIFNTDLDGRWVYLNPAWEALTGYSIEESIGTPLIDLVVPEDRQRTLDAFQALLEGQMDFYSQEMQLMTKSGEARWLSMEVQATLSNQGKLIGTYGSFHDISTHKNIEAQLRQNALYDSLTGLPNRVLFLERLRHTYRAYRRNHDHLFAVLFVDIDSFKEINDTLGHLVGDRILEGVAKRLADCLRPGDTIARLGGDEFTILLPQINLREDVTIIADRLLEALRPPFEVADHPSVSASATIGIALCCHPYEQPEDLLRNADIALYQAKEAGKARYVLFQPSMHPGSVAAFQLEANLRQALETHAFTLYFQPVFDLSSEGLVGFEALLRWHHPNHGLLLPQDFLEIAQECGLILPMGWQVLEQACAQLQTWQQRYQPRPPLSMGINLNPQQLLSPDLVPRLRHVLDQYAIEPLQLKLELSGVLESMSVEDLHRRLQRLKELGVTICLDRVSGLDLSTTDNEMLAAVVDEVKLDPALILCMESEASLEKVRTLVVAARRLNCQVGCAGIEDGPKLAQLRAFKCDQGQGWFFAKPCSAAEIETHWESHNIHRDEFSSSLNAPAIILNSETQQSQLSLFGRQSWTIGRSTDSAIVLPDRWVSRYHAELQCMSNGDVYFVDLGSGNGSFVNEQRVTMPVLLKGGDRLMVGQTHLEFFMPSNVSAIDETPSGGLPSPKTVLMMQSSKLQGEVWREALTSQGLSLIWLQPNVDLVQLLEQRTKTHQPLPDLLLLDMTVIKPNPYSFCRWCGQEYQDLQIILTSGSRTHVPASERQWAINQGAKDLLSAFPEHNIFGNMVDVVTKVRIVLSTLGMEPSEQTSLSEVLMSIRTSINRATLH